MTEETGELAEYSPKVSDLAASLAYISCSGESVARLSHLNRGVYDLWDMAVTEYLGQAGRSGINLKVIRNRFGAEHIISDIPENGQG